MQNLTVTLLIMLTFFVSGINAQEKKPLNFLSEQLAEQLLNQITALSEPKLVKAQAELLRKHYEALIESGFSKSEALQIVIAMASQDK